MSINSKTFFDTVLKEALIKDPLMLQKAEITNKSIGIDLNGSEGGQWTLSFDSAGGCKLESALTNGAACTIQTSDKTFSGVLEGSVNVAMAYMMRKIKIQGDSNLAIKVGLTLKSTLMR